MSRYLLPSLASLAPYVPGEQPQDRRYIKLNTNESPFPPSPKAQAKAAEALKRLQLYPDPDGMSLVSAMAERLGLSPDQVLLCNGSDEILDQAFMAFCDGTHPAVFPDISYGFYKVFAEFHGVPYREIPLRADFSICPEDYFGAEGMIVIANPNAPTGLALKSSEIEEILMHNPKRVVVIDEAYIDFGGASAVPLIVQYDNLLVTQTFSKSRSMAGARLGMGFACKALIDDLKKVKYSTNPYNVNAMTLAAGLGAWEDEAYTRANVKAIRENREETEKALRDLGFETTDSRTNFLFARHPGIGGEALYQALKAKGVLVRHFSAPRINDSIRVTVGSKEEMEAFVRAVREVLEAQ